MDANEAALPVSMSTRATPRRPRTVVGGSDSSTTTEAPRVRTASVTGPDGDFEPRERSEFASLVFNGGVAVLRFVIGMFIRRTQDNMSKLDTGDTGLFRNRHGGLPPISTRRP